MTYFVTLLAELLPDDPNVITGHTLTMTCQSHSSQYHAKDLRFEFRLTRERGYRRVGVDASDVRVINATLVEMRYKHVRQRYDRATVVCYHRSRRTAVNGMQIIKVGRELNLFRRLISAGGDRGLKA